MELLKHLFEKITYEGEFLVGTVWKMKGDANNPERVTHTQYEIPNTYGAWDHDSKTRVRSLKQGSGAAFIREGDPRDIVAGDNLWVRLGNHIKGPDKIHIVNNYGELSYESIGDERLPELLESKLIESSILRTDPEGLSLYDNLLQEQFDIYFENWHKKVVDVQKNKEAHIRMFYIIPPEKKSEFQKVFMSAEEVPKSFSEFESRFHDRQLPRLYDVLPIDCVRKILGEHQYLMIKQREARWKFRNPDQLNEEIREEYFNLLDGSSLCDPTDQTKTKGHSPIIIAESLKIKHPELQKRLVTFNR